MADSLPQTIKFCLCGCGTQVKSTWVRGHHSRVNNISKRPDIREKRRQKFIQLHQNGTLGPIWNKGLSKETDARVAAYGAKGAATWTDEKREFYANKMSDQWKEGSIVPLTGPDHPQWQGGTSSITQRCRASHQLYKEWKYPILYRDSFSCQNCKQTSSTVKLAVHHNGEFFCDIVKKFLPEDHHLLSWDEETVIIEKITVYHIDNKVSGVTLCYDCHAGVHRAVSDSD